MTASASPPADRDHGAFVLRPFLDVCIASGLPALVETSRDGQLVGLVEVQNGRIWRCFHLDHDGDRALDDLLDERLDEVVVRRGDGTPRPRNVFAEARLGERSPDSPPDPPADAHGEAQRSDFESNWDTGVMALLRRDFPAALEAFRSAARLRPADPGVRANLTRLREMGFGAGA